MKPAEMGLLVSGENGLALGIAMQQDKCRTGAVLVVGQLDVSEILILGGQFYHRGVSSFSI
jgi:hypothetical protein